MTTRLEITLDVQGIRFYLDTYGVETIPLTFNIADIKDISVTKGSFSKSIKIPETSHNRDVFNNISDLNSQSDFNPNLRNRAYILIDSQMVIDGYFQLTDISVDHNVDKSDMTLVIFTDNNDLYTVLGEEYIEDLNLSQYDHTWNDENIINSWTQSYTNGYYYPLIDYGNDWIIDSINGVNIITSTAGATYSGCVRTGDMFPATYNRVIWDSIIREAGFSWFSNSLTQSTPFDEMIIPINTTGILVSEEYKNKNIFRIGVGTQQVIKSTSQNIISGYSFVYQSNNGDPFMQQPTTSRLYLPETRRVRFDDETPPNGDPNNKWSSILYEYTNNESYSVSMRFAFDMTIEQLFYYSKAQPPNLQLMRSMDEFGNVVAGGVPFKTCDGVSTTNFYNVATQSGWTELTSAPFGKFNQFQKLTTKFYSSTQVFLPGEKVWLQYTFAFSGNGDYDVIIPSNGRNYFYVNVGNTMSKIGTESYVFNELTPTATVNQPISLSSCLPRKIKKRDYLLSLIKMFNLIVEPSKEYPKTLRIETRDYYYNSGEIKTWKPDLLDPVEIQILADNQNKRTTFSYKPDNDYLNTDYTNITKKTYGEYRYVTENEFVDGEKRVEVIFSPTPITSISNTQLIIPKIGVVNNNIWSKGACNIRILQKKLITGLGISSYWMLNTKTLDIYPYSGHLNDPFTPTSDINFGQIEGLYYDQTDITNNNLYNSYWEKMIEEISDRESRIITCSVYLTPYDIINFKFNDNIYLDFGKGGQYYKVNKIDYDPTTISTSKVELIKTKYITVPRKSSIRAKPIIWENPVLTSFVSGVNNRTVPMSGILGVKNDISGSNNAFVVGNFNNIKGKEALVVGNNNNALSSKSFITGDNNIVNNSYGLSIIGNNNTIDYGVDNSIVIGDGMSLSNSNTINISGVLVVNNNYINAGVDEILNPFSDNSIINFISGGVDAVRDLGSQTNIMLISGGRDKVI